MLRNTISSLAAFFCVLALFFNVSTSVSAQTENEVQYQPATVKKILEEQQINDQNTTYYVQKLLVELTDGEQHEIDAGTQFQPLTESQRLEQGQAVIVGSGQLVDGEGTSFILADVYRLPLLLWLALGFVAVVLLVSGKQGVFSLFGSVVSLGVLVYFVAPQLLAGVDPLQVSLIGAAAISSATIYLTHGWNLKSHVSFISMIASLVLVLLLSLMSVSIGSFVGLGSEEAYFLQFSDTYSIDLRGLLLAGIVLGALGVLDDIIVSQVSVVFELYKAKKKTTFQELYARALQVGKDHISSLVNTLVLAYAGANLPLFLLLYANEATPLWVTLNSEIIAEEIIRTLIGSMGLVCAVPIATICAVFAAFRWSHRLPNTTSHHGHSH